MFEVYRSTYVLEGNSSPMFSKSVSYCCVVRPILVVNIDSPRCALQTHISPVYVLEAYILRFSTVHTFSQSLESVLDSNHEERLLSALFIEHQHKTQFHVELPFRKVTEQRSGCELSASIPMYILRVIYVSATTTARHQCC